MRLHALDAVYDKEVRESLRDRRALAMALLFPLMGPIVLATLVSIVARTSQGDVDGSFDLALAGRANAPNLVAFLEAQGARIVPPPEDPERAVREGRLPVVVVIPPEHGERLRAGRPAPVQVIVDESRQSAGAAARRAHALLGAWSGQLGAMRLMARGVHPSAPAVLAIETVDVATPESRAALILAVMPYFVVLAIFLGGMYVAIDATAGERERQSLEPLLVNPVPRWQVVAGKIAAVASFSTFALGETLLGFRAVPWVLPLSALGFQVRLEPGVLFRAFLLLLPLVLLASAAQVLVAAQARSFKAAQASLSVLMMIPVLPGMIIAFLPVAPKATLMLVPTLGEQLLLQRLLRGDPIPWHYPAITAAVALAGALLVAWGATRCFEGEGALFGRG